MNQRYSSNGLSDNRLQNICEHMITIIKQGDSTYSRLAAVAVCQEALNRGMLIEMLSDPPVIMVDRGVE